LYKLQLLWLFHWLKINLQNDKGHSPSSASARPLYGQKGQSESSELGITQHRSIRNVTLFPNHLPLTQVNQGFSLQLNYRFNETQTRSRLSKPENLDTFTTSKRNTVMEYIFELPFKVRDYECDIQGIVNNAVYQNYLEHTDMSFWNTLA
jgi:hypothetical protein